ncbi:outer membrane protein assembly factor BamA [Buchnera aphidicola]|nr:outer membrane protein assembly factor BamA [Buchnera aphidicola]
MKNIIVRLILLFSLCCYSACSTAQTSINTKKIKFLGLHNISRKELLNDIKVSEDHTMNIDDIKHNIIKLSSTGYFDKISVSQSKHHIFFKLHEKPIIKKIICSGNFHIHQHTILRQCKLTGLKVSHIFHKKLIEILQQNLQKIYSQYGFYGTKINIDKQLVKNNYCIIHINITEGPRKVLNGINIIGNKSYPTNKILSFFSSYPNFIQRNLFHNKKYHKTVFVSDLLKLKHFYLQNGYINFHIESIKFISINNKNNFLVNIHIFEGDQYILSSVILHGNLGQYNHMFQKELSTVQLFHQYNVYDILNVKHRIQNIFLKIGCLQGKVFINTILNKENKQLTLNFYINLGPRFMINNIEIQGDEFKNDQLLHHISDQLHPGSYLDLKLIQQGKLTLLKTGYFRYVSVHMKIAPGTLDKINIIYKVKTEKVDDFDVHMGYEIDEGITCDVQYNHNNWISRSIDTNMDVFFSALKNNASFALKFPNKIDDILFSHRIFYHAVHNHDFRDKNTLNEVYGIEENFKFLKLKNNVITIGVNYDRIDSIHDNTYIFPVEKFLFFKEYKKIFLQDQFTSNVTITYSWLYDTFPKINFPNFGNKFFFEGKIFLNNDHKKFYQESFCIEQYIPILEKYKFILHTYINTGVVYSLEDTDHPYYESFNIENNNIRGFSNQDISLQSDHISNNNSKSLVDRKRIIGENFLLGKFDLIIPNFFILNNYYDKFFRTSLFFDCYGINNTNWKNLLYDILYKMKNYNTVSNVHASTGMTIIWDTPVGLIDFSYVHPVLYNIGDILKKLQCHFNHDE